MKEQILEGLKKLDPTVDAHWTADGLPNLNSFKFLAGVTVTREQLEEVAPGFTRTHPELNSTDETVQIAEALIGQGVTHDAAMVLSVESSETAQPAESSVGKLTVEITVNVSDALQSILDLADTSVDVTTLSDSDIAELSSQSLKAIDALNAFAEEVQKVVKEQIAYQRQFAVESDRRTPKRELHEIVKSMYAETAASGKVLPCDIPRARMPIGYRR